MQLGSIRVLEATLWRGLEMGAHEEVPTALAEGLKFKEQI